MTKKPAGDANDRPEGSEKGREPGVPKPPSREAIETISRQQALITDEWTGEGPQPDDASQEEPEKGGKDG